MWSSAPWNWLDRLSWNIRRTKSTEQAEQAEELESSITSASTDSSSVVDYTTRSFGVLDQAAVNMAASNGVKSRRQLAAEGPATVMAIGTAVPPFVHEQSTYADYYFDVTNCNHKTELKAKFKRICESHHHNILSSPYSVCIACLPCETISCLVGLVISECQLQHSTVQRSGIFNDPIQEINR